MRVTGMHAVLLVLVVLLMASLPVRVSGDKEVTFTATATPLIEELMQFAMKQGQLYSVTPPYVEAIYMAEYSYSEQVSDPTQHSFTLDESSIKYNLSKPLPKELTMDYGWVARFQQDVTAKVYTFQDSVSNTIYVGFILRVFWTLRISTEVPPDYYGLLELGEQLNKYWLSDESLILYFEADVKHSVGGSLHETIHVSGNITIQLSPVYIRFCTLEVNVTGKPVGSYVIYSRFEDGSFTVVPLYDITISGHIVGGGDAKITGILKIRVGENEYEYCGAEFDGEDPPENYTFENILIPPSIITRNITVPAKFESGTVVLVTTGVLEVTDTRVIVYPPFGFVIKRGDKKILDVGFVTRIVGDRPVSLRYSVSTSTSYNSTEVTFYGDTYTIVHLTVEYSGEEESSSILYAVDITINGHSFSDSGEATVAAVTTGVSQVVEQVYYYLVTIAGGGFITVMTLYLVNTLFASFSMRQIIPEDVLTRSLMVFFFLFLMLFAGFPLVYKAFASVVSMIEPISSNIQPPLSEVVSEDSPPETVASLLSYYDILLNKITGDLENYLGGLSGVTQTIIGIGLGLIALGAALAIAGGGFGGSLVSFGFGIITSIVSFFMLIVFLVAGVTISVAVAAVLIAFVTVLAIVLFVVGVIVLMIPSPTSERLAEDFLGVGIVFFIIVPIMAPLSVALYNYVLNYAIPMIGNLPFMTIDLYFWKFDLPFKDLLALLIYLIATGAVLQFIIITVTAVLSRIGLFASLGQVIVSNMFRR